MIMSQNIRFSKIARSVMEAIDDGKNCHDVLAEYINHRSDELERFFDWCEMNMFDYIILKYHEEQR